jgi:hypothetical protein
VLLFYFVRQGVLPTSLDASSLTSLVSEQCVLTAPVNGCFSKGRANAKNAQKRRGGVLADVRKATRRVSAASGNPARKAEKRARATFSGPGGAERPVTRHRGTGYTPPCQRDAVV